MTAHADLERRLRSCAQRLDAENLLKVITELMIESADAHASAPSREDVLACAQAIVDLAGEFHSAMFIEAATPKRGLRRIAHDLSAHLSKWVALTGPPPAAPPAGDGDAVVSPPVAAPVVTGHAYCDDCGREYGNEHGFPDLIVPKDIWHRISPTGDDGGLLCPSCICKRVHDIGVTRCEAAFLSGPLESIPSWAMHTMRWVENLRVQGHGWSCPNCGDGRMQSPPFPPSPDETCDVCHELTHNDCFGVLDEATHLGEDCVSKIGRERCLEILAQASGITIPKESP